MVIDRRTFVVGAACVTIASSLESVPAQPSVGDTDVSRLAFAIEGWCIPDNSGATDQIWIRLDSSWRANWR
jgi:hypothetical protein